MSKGTGSKSKSLELVSQPVDADKLIKIRLQVYFNYLVHKHADRQTVMTL